MAATTSFTLTSNDNFASSRSVASSDSKSEDLCVAQTSLDSSSFAECAEASAFDFSSSQSCCIAARSALCFTSAAMNLNCTSSSAFDFSSMSALNFTRTSILASICVQMSMSLGGGSVCTTMSSVGVTSMGTGTVAPASLAPFSASFNCKCFISSCICCRLASAPLLASSTEFNFCCMDASRS